MTEQGGAMEAPPTALPSPETTMADSAASSSDAPATTDPLRDIARDLQAVREGVDGLDTGFGFSNREGGTTTLRETTRGLQGIAQTFLNNQQRDRKILKENTTAEADTKRQHRDTKLQLLSAWSDHLEEAQQTRAAQAVDIHRVVDAVEKFGDLGDLVSWVGRWMRWFIQYAGEWFAWFCGSGLPVLTVALLAGVMIGIKHREMQQNAADVTTVAGSEGMARIKSILERNPGWKNLLKDPRPVVENMSSK